MATCYNGKVVSCSFIPSISPHLTWSVKSDRCILNSSGIKLESKILNALSELTYKYTCECFGIYKYTNEECTLQNVEGNHGHPMFTIESVSEESGVAKGVVDFVGEISGNVERSERSENLGLEQKWASKVRYSISSK